MNSRIGFMQGRFSPIIDGRIQSFPWGCWENELLLAKEIGIQLMEWTIDSKQIEINPILLPENPPWVSKSDEVKEIHRNTIVGMEFIGSKILVIPLVDNSSILNDEIELNFFEFISNMEKSLREHDVKIAIESDFHPTELSNFISRLDPELVGINYDIGNSASLGFSYSEELKLYGDRVINVHVKDRKLGGTTVPLGTGNADLPRTIQFLEEIGYEGNYILQTARAQDEKHTEAIVKYANMVEEWLHG
jgi:hexulose-6-phosphate isomerase